MSLMILSIQATFAETNMVASSYLWKAYSTGTSSTGSIFITKGRGEDGFSAVIRIGEKIGALKLRTISKYERNSAFSTYVQYDLELKNDSSSFVINELVVSKKNGEWGIERLRLFFIDGGFPLFITHHGKGYRKTPPVDDCMRFCSN